MDFFRELPKPDRSFFLFGPRGVGKSTWLAHHFAGVPVFNLLHNATLLELSRNPSLIEARIGNIARESWVVIDEIQKLPGLLDEVHRLIEDRKYRFALSGSSARKLKRSGANLLGGRAITKNMEAFTRAENKNRFNLHDALEWGSLPLVTLSPSDRADILSAYVHTYLKEEIKEEGLVRKVEPFVRFLEIAGLMNSQLLNVDNIAREARVPRPTVDTYIEILEDTLVAHKLPAYRPQAKVREHVGPKFYWFDPGVARGAAGLLFDPVDGPWLGGALETLIYHELRVYNHTRGKHRPISYYRTATGLEIDFVIETRKRTVAQKSQIVCLEIKHAKKWDHRWEDAMRGLKETGKVEIERMIGVYTGTQRYRFDDVDVWPVADFLEALSAGKVF